MTTSDPAGGLAALHPRLRRRFPQLEQDGFGNRRLHLNCGAGTLMVDTALEAMGRSARLLNSLPGEVTPAERATRDLHVRVRSLAGEFLNASAAEEVSFHVSATGALFNLALGLRSVLRPGSRLIVTDLDHMANISPWEDIGKAYLDLDVQRAGISDEGRLDAEQLLSLVDSRTGMLAVTLASNGLGTVVPLGEIIGRVRAKAPSCLVCVDAVHQALHGPLDVRALDCDFLVFSGYKVFGPMLGVLWGRRELLARLKPYRVETNKDILPTKLEQGTLNIAALAALEAALEYLLWLGRELAPGEGEKSARRALFVKAMTAVETHDRMLSREVLTGFRGLDPERFRCFGLADPERCAERVPTFAFELKGIPAAEVKQRLWDEQAIQIGDGNHYSAAVVRHFKKPSLCRASFAHYHTAQEARRFVESVKALLASS